MNQTRGGKRRADKMQKLLIEGKVMESPRGMNAASRRTVYECGAIDALANLRHLCDKHDLDFGSLDRTSYGHYAGWWLGAVVEV